MKKFKVWTPTKKYFNTLEEATAYANLWFDRYKEIVAITEYKPRKVKTTYSKPYRHGEYWRIDVNENGRKYYIEFESLEEAENYLKS